MSGFFFRRSHDTISVVGPDARKFLHSQLANDVESLKAGESRYSLLLEPTGKVTGLVRVFCAGDDEFVCDCESGRGQVVASRLARFKIRVKCEISGSVRDYFAARGLSAEKYAELLKLEQAIAAWREKDFAVDLVADQDTANLLTKHGLQQGGFADFERARILAIWPQFGADMNEQSVPSETGLTDVAVSFSKGCYPGQELVERMDSRGAVAPRSLRLVRNNSGARVGDAVIIDTQDAGIYTSVCQEFALALIKRSADARSIEIGS
ncbi:MAG: YgfZ/GcvT domain-containing protein [Actinomycetota bacterium]